MGAGSYGAGLGLAGHDPVESSSAAATLPPRRGSKFDPFTKTYVLTADGDVDQVEAVWEEIAHRLGIPLGALSFAKDVGIDVERIRNTTRERAQRTVEDVVAQALKPLVDAGDVSLERVLLAQPWAGKWEAWVRNLRDPSAPPRPFQNR